MATEDSTVVTTIYEQIESIQVQLESIENKKGEKLTEEQVKKIITSLKKITKYKEQEKDEDKETEKSENGEKTEDGEINMSEDTEKETAKDKGMGIDKDKQEESNEGKEEATNQDKEHVEDKDKEKNKETILGENEEETISEILTSFSTISTLGEALTLKKFEIPVEILNGINSLISVRINGNKTYLQEILVNELEKYVENRFVLEAKEIVELFCSTEERLAAMNDISEDEVSDTLSNVDKALGSEVLRKLKDLIDHRLKNGESETVLPLLDVFICLSVFWQLIRNHKVFILKLSKADADVVSATLNAISEKVESDKSYMGYIMEREHYPLFHCGIDLSGDKWSRLRHFLKYLELAIYQDLEFTEAYMVSPKDHPDYSIGFYRITKSTTVNDSCYGLRTKEKELIYFEKETNDVFLIRCIPSNTYVTCNSTGEIFPHEPSAYLNETSKWKIVEFSGSVYMIGNRQWPNLLLYWINDWLSVDLRAGTNPGNQGKWLVRTYGEL